MRKIDTPINSKVQKVADYTSAILIFCSCLFIASIADDVPVLLHILLTLVCVVIIGFALLLQTFLGSDWFDLTK